MESNISTPPEQKNQLLGMKALESPGRGVLCLDENGVVRFANARVAEMFGVPVADLVDSDYADLLHRLMDRFTEPERFLNRSLRLVELASATDEDVFEMQDTGVVLHRHSTPVAGNSGLPEGRVEIYSDITFRRRLEREIVERNRELARLNEELRAAQEQLVQSEKLRVLGEMAAGVAHDLNNVLGAVLANVQLLKRSKESDPLREGLDAIELAALDGAETVRRIKELAKVGAEQAYLPTDLAEIANDVLRVMQPTWQSDQTGPSIEVLTDLHVAPRVLGNPPELREALANIVLNAIQAMPQGGSVTLATGNDSRGAFLSVTDSGVGMSEDTRRRLFDPFFTTRGAEGTGLGMSIVYAIVTRHGGQIQVESAEGQGTTIAMIFPALSTPAEAAEAAQPSTRAKKRLRVLVADDEVVFATVIAEMLAETGHDPLVAHDVDELSHRLAEDEFDLLLVDEDMLPAIGEATHAKTAVVALCASAAGDAGSLGADEVLAKPVRMEALQSLTKKISQGMLRKD